MYVKIVGMQNEPEILIKDPSVYAFHIKEDKSCEVAIENEYLMVKTSSSLDQVSRLMNAMEIFKYNQRVFEHKQDTVLFEAREVMVLSQKELIAQVSTLVRRMTENAKENHQ